MHLHWRSDANDDEDMTDPEVWRCRFAPTTVSQRRNGIASHMFATCGSNSVCVVDCDTGRPVKKYLHYDEPAEVFQCLDWTVVEAGDEETLVLAVGGMSCEWVPLS